jgi:hypothetical protein
MVNSKRIAHEVRRSRLALHFGGAGTGDDIVIFAGSAERLFAAHEGSVTVIQSRPGRPTRGATDAARPRDASRKEPS